jgi:beta-glucanase (GH16 family)
MGRSWKLALGVVIVLAIAVWDVGLPGQHASSTGAGASAASSPSAAGTPATSASSSPPIPGSLRPQGKPEFAASFSGSSLDTSVWDTCYPWLSQSGCQNFGNKPEREWYLPSQDQVSGGMLHLVAQPKVTDGATATGSPAQYDCRSGMVTSYPGFKFKYGYIQIIARMPTGNGLWPALWLAAANLTWPPEVDILEAWGGPHFYAASYFHFKTTHGNRFTKAVIAPTAALGWHTFALSWTKTQLTWLLDGKMVLTARQHIPHQQMYFIADLADEIANGHGTLTAPQCNGTMLIRSVKVWKA